ncbi:MAG: hypothetical protein IT379_11050, partial [Deltaproteobacteria bacterium]|nr:hypothetical protein [Deltaproteobacteria bacterium]
MARPGWYFSLLVAAVGCGSLGSPGGGDTDLPSTASGPFRRLDDDELPSGEALTGLALDDVPDGLTLAVLPSGRRLLCYALARAAGPRAIFCASRDASELTFAHLETPVLEAELAWEGDEVLDPAIAVDDDGSVRLVYATVDGRIGIARSRDDGRTFGREIDEPIVIAAGWETAPLRRPALARLADRDWLYYDGGSGIGVATSDDGRTFRPEASPVLVAGTAGRFDAARVGAPTVHVETTVAGRERLALWYDALDAMDIPSIGLAASFDGLR